MSKIHLEFTLWCNPPKHTAQGSSMVLKNPKTGKYFIGKKSNSNAIQTKNELLAMLIPYRPEKPLQGALKCEIRLVYAWRKSETKKNRPHSRGGVFYGRINAGLQKIPCRPIRSGN